MMMMIMITPHSDGSDFPIKHSLLFHEQRQICYEFVFGAGKDLALARVNSRFKSQIIIMPVLLYIKLARPHSMDTFYLCAL